MRRRIPVDRKTHIQYIGRLHELIELCSSQNLILMIGYNLRFQPAMQAMRQQVINGAIGQVLCLLAEVGQYLPDWRPESNIRKESAHKNSLAVV